MTGNGHAGFGRGTLEKDQKAPRSRPTSAIADAEFGLGFIKLCAYFPVRHEAPYNRVGCKDPPAVCRSSPLKLEAA